MRDTPFPVLELNIRISVNRGSASYLVRRNECSTAEVYLNRACALQAPYQLARCVLTQFSQVSPPPQNSGGTYPPLSKAVISFTQSSLASLYQKLQNQSATGSDVQSAASALGLLFANMQETGFNAQLSTTLIANSDAIENNPADLTRVQYLQGKLRSIGIEISPQQAFDAFNISYDQWLALINEVKSSGIVQVESNIVVQFQARAKAMGAIPAKFYEDARITNPHLLRARANCADYGWICDAIATASPPPVDVAFAAGGLAYGALSHFGLC